MECCWSCLVPPEMVLRTVRIGGGLRSIYQRHIRAQQCNPSNARTIRKLTPPLEANEKSLNSAATPVSAPVTKLTSVHVRITSIHFEPVLFERLTLHEIAKFKTSQLECKNMVGKIVLQVWLLNPITERRVAIRAVCPEGALGRLLVAVSKSFHVATGTGSIASIEF